MRVVFATFARSLFALPHGLHRYGARAERDADVAQLHAGSSAQDCAMAAFRAPDRRLVAVGCAPLADPVLACSCAEEAIAVGCAAIMVPSAAAGERSPTHPELDGFWSLLEESDVRLLCGGRPAPAGVAGARAVRSASTPWRGAPGNGSR